MPRTGAVFTATTNNATNTFAADNVAAPASLTMGYACSNASPPSAVTFVTAAAAAATTSGSISYAIPGGPVPNDVALAFVAANDSGTISITSANATSWREVGTATNGNFRFSVYAVVVVAMTSPTNPGSTTWTSAGGSGVTMRVSMAIYRGVDTSNPVDASGSSLNSSDGSTKVVPANSVTTTRSNGYLVLAFGLRSSGTNWTDANASPSGTTARTTASTTGLSHHVRDLALTTTGATSNYTSFPDNSTPSTAVGIGWQIALRHTYGDLRATGTWSPGPSADAGNGHELERTYGGVSQHKITVSPQTTTFGADTPLPLGGTYSYNLRRYVGTWKSSAVRRSSFVDCGNRLTQGGFEQGINTWNCSSTPTQITAAAPNEANVLDGMYALSVPASTTCSQASVALAANTQYTAVLFAKTSNSGGSTVRVGYRTVSGGTVTEYGAQNHSVGTSFTRIFHQYTQGASGQTVEFFFTTGTGTHYVDDVFLSP